MEQTTRGPTFCVKVYNDEPEMAFAKALDLFQRARRELSPPPAQEAPGAPLASP